MNRDTYFEMLERIQPELEEIHRRLENWARWSQDTPAQLRCASAEGSYTPELGSIYDEQDGRIPVDIRDASKVYGVLCNPGFPYRQRLMLQLWYVKRANPHVICRKCGVNRQVLSDELNKARRIVENRLKL